MEETGEQHRPAPVKEATSDENPRSPTNKDNDSQTNGAQWEGDTTNKDNTLYTLDVLVKDLGQCGCFQVVLLLFGYLPLLPGSWGIYLMIFGKYNPGWTCQDVSLSEGLGVNNTLPQENGRNMSGFRSPLCTCDDIKASTNWTFNSVASTIVTEWSLVCGDSWKASLITSIQMTGVLFGAYAGGQIGDKFGRKFSIHGSCALMVVMNVIAVFSISWQMYAVVMFFIGLSAGSSLATCYVYNFEFLSSWWRGFVVSFPLWSVATCLFALSVMVLKNWRHVHIAVAFVSLVAFLPVIWLPESLRFLTVHGHLEKANKVVKKIARLNKAPLPDTSIMKTIAEIELQSLKAGASYTYLDLFHRNVRHYTVVLCFALFVLSLSQYMIGFSLSSFSGNFFLNLLMFSSLPFPARIFAVVIVTKVGRKVSATLFLFLASMCSFVIVVIQLLASQGSRGTPTTVLAIGITMLIEAAWGSTAVLVNELFPSDVRTLSYGFCSASARLAGIIAPYLIPKHSMPIFAVFILQGCLQLIAFLAVLTLPESRGKPLKENLVTKTVNNKQQDVSVDA
ncbi:hypothetical protein BsWGS_21525 [Bradybaena similaris]